MKSRSFMVLGALAFASLPSVVIAPRAAAQNLSFTAPDSASNPNSQDAGSKPQDRDALIYGLIGAGLLGILEFGQSSNGSIDSAVSKGMPDMQTAGRTNPSAGGSIQRVSGITRDETLPTGGVHSGSLAPEGNAIVLLAAGIVPISYLLYRRWRAASRKAA